MRKTLILSVASVSLFAFLLMMIPQQSAFSELYFVNHTNLRQNIFADREYSFTFAVKNLEGKKEAYYYKCYALFENKTFYLDDGAFLLEEGQKKEVKVLYSLPRGFERAKILVYVKKMSGLTKKQIFAWPDPRYSKELEIYFWVDEIVPVKIKRIN